MDTPATPRSAALDLIRVLGIVAIVYGHTWSEGWTTSYLLKSWRVPAFFLLSGYLWATRRSLREETRRRTRTLLVPYATWLMIIAIPLLGWHAAQGDSVARLAAGIAWGAQLGRPFSAFWFIAALFLTAVLVRAFERFPRALTWSVAGLGLLAVYLAGPTLAHTPYSIGIVPACVLFVLAGQELKRHRHQIRRPALTGVALIVAAGALVAIGAYRPIDVKYGSFGLPFLGVLVAVGISVGLILIAETIVPYLPGRAQDGIRTLAAAGLAVLLGHAAVLWVSDSRLGWPRWLAFGLALVVPFAIGLIANRTRFAPFLTGRVWNSDRDRSGSLSGLVASSTGLSRGSSIRPR